MISITGIRFLIEFSSILVLVFLCIMHEFTDVTLAKQFNIDHASNQGGFEDVESTSLHLPSEDEKPFVKFTPEALEFGPHPIGMPIIETVYVHNGHDEINIQMISISGNTEHFHCSFFEDKIVPARSNTSFQVVFLARQEEGLVNNTLYIHSSVGSFQYRVSAFGEASPFRVRPLIGARVPLNSSFASLIYIYNPFSTPLQLTEMYTSGGGLHLELPEDEYEATSSAWKVPPYETRPVMKAHFVARIASNHTSYIRIRTNATDVQLMLPVEVEVSNSPGLYSPLDTLDFGVLRSRHDPPKILPIQVINAAMKFIYVQNIVVTPLSEGLSVEFDGPIRLPPRTSTPYHIANLILDPSQFSCTGLCIGKVLIKSKNNQYKLSIPFVVRIIQGELHYNSSLLHFFINESSTSEQRSLIIENRFDTPINVHDISLPDEAKPYFKLTIEPPNTLPVLLPIGQPFSLLKIEFTPSHQLSHFTTVFRLLTNFSYFDLNVFAYNGRLDLFIPNSSDQTKLDLGLVGLSEQKSTTFVVTNHNPIPVRLVYWHSTLTGVTVEFVGTSHGNITAVNQRLEPSSLSRSEATLLQPKHFAVFRVHVNKFSKEGAYDGIVSVSTPFETLNVPLLFSVLRGSLLSSKVLLPKAFPGRIVNAFLNVKSNYTSEIKLKGAFVEPKDERFQIKLTERILKPGEDNQIQVLFNASALCSKEGECYTSFDIGDDVGHLWHLGSGLIGDSSYIDKEVFRLRRNHWQLLTESDRNPAVNIRLQVDGFGSFVTEAQAQMYWPRLSNKLAIRFPSVKIGRTVIKEVMIENPADRPLFVQAFEMFDYPNPEVLVPLLATGNFHQQLARSELDAIDATIPKDDKKTDRTKIISQFTLLNVSSTSNPNRISEWHGVKMSPNAYTVFLPPGSRQRLAISFTPRDEKNFTSFLVLRNNLTVLELVVLRGEGGRGILKIGKMLPNTPNSKLIFDFPEKNFEKKCRAEAEKIESGKASNLAMNSLVVKEKFKATNIGRMGLQIRHFLIDGHPCEGHGFHINHCEPVFLMPNQSLDLEIVYSPDFTQTTIMHDLVILVDDDQASVYRYKLIVNVPKKILQTCLDVLPRPSWENFIYYLLILMAIFVLLLSILVAISDAHRISTSALLSEEEDEQKNENHNIANNKSFNAALENNKKHNLSSDSNLNGKQLQQGQQVSGLNKVRNRRGNKTSANINSSSSSNPSRQIGKSGPSGLKTESQALKEEEESQDKQRNAHLNIEYSDSPSWNNVMRKKLLRQDSSSSEHSQRSSDNSSSSRSTDKECDLSNSRYGKQSVDSFNEALQQQSLKTSLESRANSKEQATKSFDESKIANIKKNKSSKHSKQMPYDKVQKNSSPDATKSSTESLNFASKLESEITTKTRSATLPLPNETKNILLNENVSISQSDIVSNEYENAPIGVIGKPNKAHNNKLPKASFERYDNASYYRNNYRTEFPKLNSNAIPESNYFYENRIESTKDIWDLPITNFDSESAMNLLVQQTEEFAYDDKFVPGKHRKFPMSERTGNTMPKLRDDKWEIGEWNNDLANTNMSSHKQREFENFARFNRNMNSSDAIQSKNRLINRFNKDSFETNYQPNSLKNFVPFGHSMVSPSSIGNSSLTPNNPTTFSPVIGRPTPNNPVQPSTSSNPTSSSRLMNSNHPNFNEFNLNSPLDSAFSLKPNLLDLDFLNQPTSLSQFPSTTTTTNPKSIINENNPNSLNSLFTSTAWTQNSLNNFSPNAFVSSSDSIPKSSTSSDIFNFAENQALWETSSGWTSYSSNVDSPQAPISAPKLSPSPNSFSGINDKMSGSSKWPSSSSSSSAFVNSQNYSKTTNPSSTATSANNNNRVWSPFDSYCNPSPPSMTGQSQSNGTSEGSLFEASVFELFGNIHKSPWSPLDTLDTSSSPSIIANSASQTSDPFNDRFPSNASPASSSSSNNPSSSTS